MSIFSRLFKIGQAEAHSAVDKLEDPIKMTEQGIRDMKEELDKALHGLAELKALAIRARNDVETNQAKAQEYEHKAMQLLRSAKEGRLEEAEADRLATEALIKKDVHEKHVLQAQKDKTVLDDQANQMEANVRQLKANITKWENELKTLKARVRVSTATANINKQLAHLDTTGTVAMLERMKEKVAQQEALAQAYGDIADGNKSVDQEIDKALENVEKSQAKTELEKLKLRMGLEQEQPTASESAGAEV